MYVTANEFSLHYAMRLASMPWIRSASFGCYKLGDCAVTLFGVNQISLAQYFEMDRQRWPGFTELIGQLARFHWTPA